MSSTSTGTLLGLGLAVLVAARFEGAMATGVVGGYLCGASVALLGAAWIRHCVRIDSRRALRAMVEAFFMKFGGLLVAAFTLRYVAAAGEAADWRGFVVAYAAAAVVTLLLSTRESARTLRSPRGESAL